MSPALTVIIPAYNPAPARLKVVLEALRAQTLPVVQWETIVVNNASTIWPDPDFFATHAPANCAVVEESTPGLSAARFCGFAAARGDSVVLVDDDNVLSPDYLEVTLRLFALNPTIGVAGGKIHPRFETPPPEWTCRFFPLLALRDFGDSPLLSTGLRPAGSKFDLYPAFAPVGAGMALRRAAWQAWLDRANAETLTDRRGEALSSSGDNDIVFSAMHAGWEVGYFPELTLTHLIPAARLTRSYLGRLNRAIARSWVEFLRSYSACPWGPIEAWTVPIRNTKAWLRGRAWSGPAEYVEWQGTCGHFEGRAARERKRA
jgi:glycosyltransferase involved in cell wall biosynthesis